jgi:hypothetical protein
MLWSPFFVISVALLGVYKSRTLKTACESRTACFRQKTGVLCCRKRLLSRNCILITFNSKLYGRGRLDVLRPSFCFTLIHNWLLILLHRFCTICNGTCTICNGTRIICNGTCIICNGTCTICNGTCTICNGTCTICNGTRTICNGTCTIYVWAILKNYCSNLFPTFCCSPNIEALRKYFGQRLWPSAGKKYHSSLLVQGVLLVKPHLIQSQGLKYIYIYIYIHIYIKTEETIFGSISHDLIVYIMYL